MTSEQLSCKIHNFVKNQMNNNKNITNFGSSLGIGIESIWTKCNSYRRNSSLTTAFQLFDFYSSLGIESSLAYGLTDVPIAITQAIWWWDCQEMGHRVDGKKSYNICNTNRIFTIKYGALVTPNVLKSCKVYLSHHVFGKFSM